MDEALNMQEAVMSRIHQFIRSPYELLAPGEWKGVLGISPDSLRRLCKLDSDFADVIVTVGKTGTDQRTNIALYCQALQRKARRDRARLLEKNKI